MWRSLNSLKGEEICQEGFYEEMMLKPNLKEWAGVSMRWKNMLTWGVSASQLGLLEALGEAWEPPWGLCTQEWCSWLCHAMTPRRLSCHRVLLFLPTTRGCLRRIPCGRIQNWKCSCPSSCSNTPGGPCLFAFLTPHSESRQGRQAAEPGMPCCKGGWENKCLALSASILKVGYIVKRFRC